MNLIQIYYNVSRAIEIAKAGNHTIGVYYNVDPDKPETKIHPKDIQAIEVFFGVKFEQNAGLMVEIHRPTFDEIFPRSNGETMDEIDARIKAAQKGERPDTFNAAGLSLLKTAYDRLNLAVWQVVAIKDVSRTIAKLSGAKEVKAEHIAEAIQYQAVDENATTWNG